MRLRMTMRFVAAVGLGVLADLFVLQDAYAYESRLRHTDWVTVVGAMVALLVVPAVLNFSARMMLPMAAVVWASTIAAHTLVLVQDIQHDPTAHNLWPFEYLGTFFSLALPLVGAAIGRFVGAAQAERART